MRDSRQQFSLRPLWHCFYQMMFFQCRVVLYSLVLMLFPIVYAADYFNRDSLEQTELFDLSFELSYFERPDGQLPGVYNVEIYVNDRYFGARNINFITNNDGQLYPKIPITLLDKIDVDISAIPILAEQPKVGSIIRIGECIPGAASYFDFSSLRLYLSIPENVIRKEEPYNNLKMMILTFIDQLVSQ